MHHNRVAVDPLPQPQRKKMNFFKKSLENVLIDMKLAQKQMKRESKKREAASKSSIKAVQKYLKEGTQPLPVIVDLVHISVISN